MSNIFRLIGLSMALTLLLLFGCSQQKDPSVDGSNIPPKKQLSSKE
ncbi:MAG: hypothetical protein QNJ63_11575 [Calothrix sp. MO_192.B10]|nr:hypothetical protein [Calothrix sp. MO_192.B10]